MINKPELNKIFSSNLNDFTKEEMEEMNSYEYDDCGADIK